MRKITSLILVISGFIELVTSIVLYIVPSGRVAYWADYRLLGLSKPQWGDIHITVGTLLLLSAAFHIYFNWRQIIAYLKNKTKKLVVFNKNFIIALAISLYVAIGTLYTLSPMSYVIYFGEHITELGNKKYGEPPYGHAELSSLKMFCKRMGIDLSTATNLLKNGGINFTNEKESIVEIAKNNNITPEQLYRIIKTTANTTQTNQLFPEAPFPGFGKQSIKNICKKYKLDIEELIATFNNAGFVVEEDDTIKEIGAKNNSNTMEVFEILKNFSEKNTLESQ